MIKLNRFQCKYVRLTQSLAVSSDGGDGKEQACLDFCSYQQLVPLEEVESCQYVCTSMVTSSWSQMECKGVYIFVQGLSQNWCLFSLDGLVTPSIRILKKCTYFVVHYLSNKHPWTSLHHIDLIINTAHHPFKPVYKVEANM